MTIEQIRQALIRKALGLNFTDSTVPTRNELSLPSWGVNWREARRMNNEGLVEVYPSGPYLYKLYVTEKGCVWAGFSPECAQAAIRPSP